MSKESQLEELHDQLQILHNNLNEFDTSIKDTARQFQSIQNLALMHGSLFMASHTVFGSHYRDNKEGSGETLESSEAD